MPDPERPDPPATPAPSFGQVAQSGVLPEIRRSQAEYETAQKERAKRVGARIEEEKQVIAAQPHEAPPEAQTPGPPPSRGLTPFLAPVEGERPENTIAKLIQGVGLLATGVAGRKDARGALSALTGALKGWQEGDKERADRHFADWQAQSDAMLKSWQTKRARWQDLQEDKKLTAQQRARLFELDLLKEGFPVDAAKANLEGWQYLQGITDKHLEHVERLAHDRAILQKSFDLAAVQHEYAKEMEERKRQHAIEDQERFLSQYSKDDLRSMGQDWFLTGKLPRTYGKPGIMLQHQIIKEGNEWAKSQGIDPMSRPQVQAEVTSAKGALNKLRGVNAVQMAAIRRLDGHLDALVRLSEKIPRSEIHAVNEAIVKGQREYAGSPDAAAYVFQSFEASMELSRVVVGTAQGDAATREEARKSISSGLANGQVRAVVDQMRQNAHRNIETNRESEKALTAIIESAGGFKKESGAESTAKGETKTLTVPGVGEVKVTVTP